MSAWFSVEVYVFTLEEAIIIFILNVDSSFLILHPFWSFNETSSFIEPIKLLDKSNCELQSFI
jgi:hypothetical protein